MFEREIKFIYDFNLNKVKKIGSFLTYDQLISADLHPAILKYISAEIDYLIFEDRQKMLRDSVFDYTSEKINQYFLQIGEEVKSTKRFSLDYVKKLILHATSFNVNFLVRPNWSLVKFIYDEEEHKTTLEIKQILNYVYYYDYLKDVLISYLNKKKLLSLNNTEFKQLLIKIDKIGIDSYLNDMLETSLGSISEFLNFGNTNKSKVPIKAVEGFLKEKGLIDHINALQKSLAGEEKYKYEISDLMAILNKIKIHKTEESDVFEEVKVDEPVTEEKIEIEEEIVSEDIVESVSEEPDTKIYEEQNDGIEELVDTELDSKNEEIDEEVEKAEFDFEIKDPVLEDEAIEDVEETLIEETVEVAEFDSIQQHDEIPEKAEEEFSTETETEEILEEESADKVKKIADDDEFEDLREILNNDDDLFTEEFGEDFAKKTEEPKPKKVAEENVNPQKQEETETLIIDQVEDTNEIDINDQIIDELPDELEEENKTENEIIQEEEIIDDEIVSFEMDSENEQEEIVEEKNELIIDEIEQDENDEFIEESDEEVVLEFNAEEEFLNVDQIEQEIVDDAVEEKADDLAIDNDDEAIIEFDSDKDEELIESHVDDVINIEEEIGEAVQQNEELDNEMVIDIDESLIEVDEEVKLDESLDVVEESESEKEELIKTEEPEKNSAQSSGIVQPSFFDEKIILEENDEEFEEIQVEDAVLDNYEFNIEEDQQVEENVNKLEDEKEIEVQTSEQNLTKEIIETEDKPEEKLETETSSPSTNNVVEKVDLSDIMENKNMARIVEKLFDNDMEEFAELIEKLSDCTSVNEAHYSLNEYLKDNGINNTSKEALKFFDIISEYFDH